MENLEEVEQISKKPLGETGRQPISAAKDKSEKLETTQYIMYLQKFEKKLDKEIEEKDQVPMFSETTRAKHGIITVTAEEIKGYER